MAAIAVLEPIQDTLFGEGEVVTVEAGVGPDSLCLCSCFCQRPSLYTNTGDMLNMNADGYERPGW